MARLRYFAKLLRRSLRRSLTGGTLGRLARANRWARLSRVRFHTCPDR